MSERSGVEIDYCPECRGVWLDRGELDKIIERAENDMTKNAPAAGPIIVPVAQQQQQRPQYGERNDNRNWNDRDRGYDNRDGYRKSKKESWIADLFG
jgi:hypothetical protein